MDTPTETVVKTDAEVKEKPTATEGTEVAENATTETENSTLKDENLTALIEAEKKHGKPDPNKARERFLKKQKESEPEEDAEDSNEDERPVTRRELEELLARQAHDSTLENQQGRLLEISRSLAESDDEAELIRAVHANRIFPAGMPLEEQLAEAHVIATAKRTQAKNAEMARKIASQNTVSRNTATTHRDPQAALEPDMAPDLKASMQRAGYTYNGTSRRYEKKLPNGRTLVKEAGKPPYLAG